MLHLDKDRWKSTMFTNEIYLSVCSCNKISLVYIYDMTLYDIVINNTHSNAQEEKEKRGVHSELYGSGRLVKSSTFLLQGEQQLRVYICNLFTLESEF